MTQITLRSTAGELTLSGLEWTDIINTAYTHGWLCYAEHMQYWSSLTAYEAASMADALEAVPPVWFIDIDRDKLLDVLRGGIVGIT